MKKSFNAYRNGRVHVQAKLCDSCIYRPDSPLFSASIKAKAKAGNNAVICHGTLFKDEQAVCRGFYERDKTPVLKLADSLGLTEFVPLERKKR